MRELQAQPTDPLFPSRDGGPLTRDAIERRLAKHIATAQRKCPSLRTKRVTMHVLRHTAAMMLLSAGIDTTTIALWLGHEQERTTRVYLHADLGLKQRVLDQATPTERTPRTLPRPRPPARVPQQPLTAANMPTSRPRSPAVSERSQSRSRHARTVGIKRIMPTSA
jgi:hypothetical protein